MSLVGGRSPHPVSAGERWLAICVDGVPFNLMAQLWNDGHFRMFHRPSPVVSTFPSHSEVALTAALHAPPVPGYEHRFFDIRRNRLRGGSALTVFGGPFPYLRRLDYTEPGLWKGLHFVFPEEFALADLGRLCERVKRSQKKQFVAHLASFDAALHTLEPDQLRNLLLEVERTMRRLLEERDEGLNVLLFSDHGNTLQPSRMVPVRSGLREAGWRPRTHLVHPTDVVIPEYGLVGFVALYCHPEARAHLAADMVSLPGVDLTLYLEEANSVVIQNRQGQRASIRWDFQGTTYWYSADQGDVLGLVPLLEAYSAEQTRRGYRIHHPELLRALVLHQPYPDTLHRIRAWAESYHVVNRCDVVASLAPGYHYGKPVFEWFVELKSTHGGLDWSSSVGFAMATWELPAVLRIEQVLDCLGGARDRPRAS